MSINPDRGPLRQGQNSSRSIGPALGARPLLSAPAEGSAAVAAAGVLAMATNPTDGDTVTIGEKTYSFVAESPAIAASGILTLETNPTEGDSVTIGEVEYTFGPDGVAIGVDAAATQANLVAAINHVSTGHPLVTAGAPSSDDITITAKTPGVAGNSIATTSDLTSVTDGFAEATLTGGAEAVSATGDQVAIGNDAAASRAALRAKINHSETGHPLVTAGGTSTVTITAKTPGVAGNSITTTDTLTAGADGFSAATLQGGADSTPSTVPAAAQFAWHGGYLYYSPDGINLFKVQFTAV